MNGLGVLNENNRARKLNTSPHFILIKPSIDSFTNFYAKQQIKCEVFIANNNIARKHTKKVSGFKHEFIPVSSISMRG